MRLKRWLAAVAALFAASLLLPASAYAQAQQCLVTASSPPATAVYDPFNPSALNVNAVQITFVRFNGPGGAKPQLLDFYIHSNNTATNGIQLIPTGLASGTGSLSGAIGQDIFYSPSETQPNITVPLPNSPIPGVLRYGFSGNNAASDTFTVNFNIVIPANLSLNATTALNFDIEYGCDGTGSGPPFSERRTATNAFTLNVRVKSGIQASYIGPALNFGEVGDKTDAQAVLLDPAAGLSKIRVASSGPYTISMASANGYRMTYSGGNPALENQNLRYTATFLGSTGSPASPGVITKTCGTAAGLGSPPLSAGRDHPLTVQLQEGGLDGTPEVPGNYSDTLTFTITPLVAGSPGVTCP